MTLATVVSASPLTVRERVGATAVPARLVGGSSYAPVVGDRVLVEFVSGFLYVFGKA